MQAVKDRGLGIPNDMALVGFDDVSIARYMEPPLTTVHLPAYQLGWKSGEVALQLVEHENADINSQLLMTELIVRDSSGAIKKDDKK